MAYSSAANLDAFRQSLFAKKGRVNANMRKAAEAAAERIMAKSQSNSPVDTHNLEEAHHIKEKPTRAGNIGYTVEVSGLGYGSDNPRDVGNYILEMHENYESYKPGAKSLAKMAAGHEVGSQFLSRALTSEKPYAIDMIRQAVKKGIKG